MIEWKKEDIAFAPMEGITLFPFRRVHQQYYPGISRYYTPFLAANQTLNFKKKELREILPEHNRGIALIPQVLSNKADQFVWAVCEIASYGYEEINLNLGCPSPTVVTRGRGAGFLADPEALDRFFEEAFSLLERAGAKCRISVKTRIGLTDVSEAEDLLKVYNRYPLSELIIHPRLRSEMYRGEPHLEVFRMFAEGCVHPLCYNGDIRTEKDAERIRSLFPQASLMIGRGLVGDPGLICRLRAEGDGEMLRFRAYLDSLLEQYQEALQGEYNVICKMKELWFYMGEGFPDRTKGLKKIRKARTKAEYQAAVEEVTG